ncbi:MAG TPA: tRNA pseudouridine(55) synthase TruB, partial [Cyanophyceae cyanobacterium]
MQGFLNLNKPAGFTSHDCVARVRRLVRLKRVGHGGTLDPAATGVLPIALGKATRLLQYMRQDKAYQATIRLGVRTTTDDLEGEVIATQSTSGLTLETVLP